jgi:site-specific DNA-methyltransferase (adenine-specific)
MILEETARHVFAQDDALVFMGALHSEIADIVFLDPPFNLRKRYGAATYPESSAPDAYERYLVSVLSESVRVLRPGGSFFLYHLPYWALRLSPHILRQLEFRHWIAVSMKNGFARGKRLYPAHYALLYATKGEPANFRRPHLKPRVCRSCGQTIPDYGGYAGVMAEKGVNLSDVWDDLSPVRHQSKKHREANELPQAITDRIVHIAGSPDGLLVDPFVGSGTSIVSALMAEMRVAANDLDPEAWKAALARIQVPATHPAAE